jgi:hypothetical protein
MFWLYLLGGSCTVIQIAQSAVLIYPPVQLQGIARESCNSGQESKDRDEKLLHKLLEYERHLKKQAAEVCCDTCKFPSWVDIVISSFTELASCTSVNLVHAAIIGFLMCRAVVQATKGCAPQI